jgi:PAS domain S-box-containing protein
MLNLLKRLFQKRPAEQREISPGHQAALTGQRQAEESLRRSEEQLQGLVGSVTDYAIFLLDPGGHILTWNAGAERINGYTAGEIIGQHFSRFYPSDAVAAGWPAHELEQAAATGRIEDEGWRLRKDGSRFWANIVITALKDDAGQVRAFLKITRDLTEPKQAEEDARRLLQEETARRAAEAGTREAQQAQREERRQREQLHVTLSSIGDAVIVTDARGLVTFLNPVAQTLTGWGLQEAVGQPLENVFHIINEATRQPVESPVAKVLREGHTVGLANHTVLIARDGKGLSIDDSGAPIRGEDGQIEGVVLVFRDVTESRRETAARLRLAAIVESSDDAIISKDLNGSIVSWNKAAERLYGYTAEEIIGKPISILAPPDRPDELPELMERLRQGERMEHHETVRRRKDGSLVEVSLTISPVKDAEGRIIGASKTARDITARKRHEADLRFLAEASKELAGLLDVPSTLQKLARLAVPHFADWCTVDMLGTDGSLRRLAVAHVDPAKVVLAQELHRRYPPDPAAPYGVWNVLRTGKSELVSEISDAMLADQVKDEYLLQTLRELGLRSYLAVPLTVRGSTVGVLTFIAAESGRRYDSADQQLAEDLAHRATIAIDNARLYSDLKEADERKDEFLAMLAHELRNPLAPIRNALHIMKMPGADRETIEQARQMTERQVQHMVRLVDDLLDVSRIMRGRIDLRKKRVELASVITQAIETAQPIIDARGQELVVSVPPDPLRLDADPARLALVIANLLHNAAKFSERAGRIWLTVERNGNDAIVRVRDQGAGIRDELLPNIFDLFVQGDRSLERAEGGLGIGLTVVRKLVQMHGGTITAQSEGPGKGSEFVVRLPGLQEPTRQHPSTTGPEPTRAPSSRRILVVDDNVDAAESIAMLLRLWGHDVRLAYNGPEALQAAEAYRPEIVLLDIGLPGINGYDVARRLRQRPESQEAMLVAVTGYGQEEDRRRSVGAGFDHHLTKPVDPGALERLVAVPRRAATLSSGNR